MNESLDLLKDQLDRIESKKSEIDRAIQQLSVNRTDGSVNFEFYRLKKKQDSLKDEIVRIQRALHPDIIA
jgi:hypothetical protein